MIREPKIALVTTAYLDNKDYFNKTKKFVDYYYKQFNNIYIIDNASVQEHYIHGAEILTQYPHFSRESHLQYKYLWRALYSLKYFFDKGYDKVIYMDNDFYILSDKMLDWAKDIDGWASPFCKKHNFPETGLQVISKDCQSYLDFVKDGYFWTHDGKTMETVLPVLVNTGLNGDRWVEYGMANIPNDVDFSAQTPFEWIVSTEGRNK